MLNVQRLGRMEPVKVFYAIMKAYEKGDKRVEKLGYGHYKMTDTKRNVTVETKLN